MLSPAPQVWIEISRRLSAMLAKVHTLTKIILFLIGGWWFVLAGLFIFPVNFISWFAILVSLLIALVLLILSVVALFKDKRRRWPTLAIGR
jgi:hypothetical protein